MLYNSTKTFLRSIIQSLEGAEEVGWDDQNESAKECLYEMFQMTGPGVTPAAETPVGKNLSRAIPHAKAMLNAIRHRDRATAVERGEAALAEMNGNRPVDAFRLPYRAKVGKQGMKHIRGSSRKCNCR